LEDFFQKLRAIQKKERGNSSLSRVRNDFYKQVRKFIDDLKDSVADDPFSEENHMLKKSIAVITEIYEKREHKIANTAIMNIHRSYHLFSGKPQFDFLDTTPLNLTSEEEKLYFSIIETLKVHRERISTDAINENIELDSLVDSDIPENNKEEDTKISLELEKIKKAEVIEDEKREDINSQILKSKVDTLEDNKSSLNNIKDNNDLISKSNDQTIGNGINTNSTKNEDPKFDSGSKDVLNKQDLNEDFPVLHDEEKFPNNPKTNKIDDPIIIGTVLFFDNMPSIIGVDNKIYGPFSPQDVVTIPLVNAEIIVENRKGRFLKI
jgi:DNA replication factor GINS